MPKTTEVDLQINPPSAPLQPSFQRKVVTHQTRRDGELKRPANSDIYRVGIDVGAQAIHPEAGAACEFELESEA